MKYRIHVTILATILTGTLPFFANAARANGDDASLVRVEFTRPDAPLTHTRIDGGGRGLRDDLFFQSPEDKGEPKQGTFGSGVRGDVFVVPLKNEIKPDRSVGTGLNRDIEFSLSGGSPPGTLGGRVRDDLFFESPEDEGEPKDGTFGSGVRSKFLPAGTATCGSSIGSISCL